MDRPRALLCMLAVYGWMPKIPKNLDGITENYIKFLNLDRKNLTTSELREKSRPFLRSINNSLVGSSKFLHFRWPDVFPIWDSNIQKALFSSTSYGDREISRYLTYIACLEHIEIGSLFTEEIDRCRRQLPRQAEALTNLRVIDLALFRRIGTA